MVSFYVRTVLILPTILCVLSIILYNIPLAYKNNKTIKYFTEVLDGTLVGYAASLGVMCLGEFIFVRSAIIIILVLFTILLYSHSVFNGLVYDYVNSTHGKGLLIGILIIQFGLCYE